MICPLASGAALADRGLMHDTEPPGPAETDPEAVADTVAAEPEPADGEHWEPL